MLFAGKKEVLQLKTEMTATTTTVQNCGRTPRRRDALRREIILALALKAVVIYGLWYAFFSEPVDDNLTGAQVGNVLFDSSLAGETSQDISDRNPPANFTANSTANSTATQYRDRGELK